MNNPLAAYPLHSIAASLLIISCVATPPRLKTNSLGMKFVPVQLPECKIWVSAFETRVQDYAVFVRETGHPWLLPEIEQSDRHPVVNISWYDAVTFCDWLSRLEGKRYRLPTDAEWSQLIGIREESGIAPGAQPQQSGVFLWGSGPIRKEAGNFCDEAFGRQYGDGYQAAWLQGYHDGASGTQVVGRYQPDRNGLFDLGGNVWEWCDDWYDLPEQTQKVVRGGSWRTGESSRLLSSFRGPDPPGVRLDSIGFRVVME